jgi:hypothetical protein
LEDLCVDGRTILKWILQKCNGKLSQDRDDWWDGLQTLINIPGWLIIYLLGKVRIVKLFILKLPS